MTIAILSTIIRYSRSAAIFLGLPIQNVETVSKASTHTDRNANRIKQIISLKLSEVMKTISCHLQMKCKYRGWQRSSHTVRDNQGFGSHAQIFVELENMTTTPRRHRY